MNPIVSTASRAVDQVSQETRNARGTLLDLGIQVVTLLQTLRTREARAFHSVLGLVGLQRRGSLLRPLAYFAAGAVAGGSLTLLLTPTTGKNLRTKLLGLIGTSDAGEPNEGMRSTPPKPTNGVDAPRGATFGS